MAPIKLECERYGVEREFVMKTVQETIGKEVWNRRKVNNDNRKCLLLGIGTENHYSVVCAMKEFLLKVWRKRIERKEAVIREGKAINK
jgi:hypothetical protein